MVLDTLILKLFGNNPSLDIVMRATAREYLKQAEWELDPNSDNGNVWKAADCFFMARYCAKEGKKPSLIAKVDKKAREGTFQGYNPSKSRDMAVREIAWIEINNAKIDSFEKLAKEKFKEGNYSEAGNLLSDAANIAKKIGNHAYAEELRIRLNSWSERK